MTGREEDTRALWLALTSAILWVSFGPTSVVGQNTGTTTAPVAPPPDWAAKAISTSGIAYTPAIYINEGIYLAQPPSSGAVIAGQFTNTSGSDATILLTKGHSNALYVKGDKSTFTLSNARIETYGNGLDDFKGLGSAVLVDAGATVVLKKVKITTNGTIAAAITNTADSTLRVYDSVLRVNGGKLPAGYVPMIGPGMMQPPAPLGIGGTARATLTLGSAKSYYYNSTIIAEGWGALSTDAAFNAYLEANDCNIKVLSSGYGAYADHGSRVVINRSRITSPTYQGVIGGQATIEFNDVTGRSSGNSVMIHSVMGSPSDVSTLRIAGGEITTDGPAILVKSANADITLDGAKLLSKAGMLIEAMVIPDIYATNVKGHHVTGVRVWLKHETVENDIVNNDIDRDMSVVFEKSSLIGAIQKASVSMDAGSSWTATANSSVTLIGGIQVSAIDAPTGVTIKAVADEECSLSGNYALKSGGVLSVAEHR